MTISSTTRKAGPFTGTGSTGPYSFTFKVFQASDLLVVKLDVATNVETTLTLTTDYTVSLNADQNSNPGGSVTLVSALAVGKKMVISSQVPYLQQTDLTNQGGFYPEVITDALDRLTIEAQQLNEGLSRAALLPITSAADAAALVADIERLASSANNLDIDANNIGAINTVATNITNVNSVATNIASVNSVAGNATNINAVNANATNINAVNANKTNIDTVAGNNANVTTVAGISANVTSVAGNATNINAVAGNATNINAVNANKTNIDSVAGNNSNITAVAGNSTNINAVNANAVNINAVAGNSANINAVNLNKTNIDAVAGNATNINTVATNNATITAVAGNATNINAVNANSTNINTVATNSTAINTVSTNITAVNSAYTNLAAILDAPTQAANAASSAAQAAASAASGMYSAVQDKSANYTIVAGDAGDLIRVSTTSGAITITLPLISSVGDGFKIAVVKWTSDANAVNIARSGSNTINGATSAQIGAQYSQIIFVADLETGTWFASQTGLGATNVNVDTFNGTGSATAFTLTSDPTTKNNTAVYISGVYQQKSTYSVSGTTLTFSTAPPSGTANIEVAYSTPLAIGTPSDGTVTAAKLATTGTADSTKFLRGDMSWQVVAVTPTAVSDQANTSTGYFDLPAGTTAQRPSSPNNGMTRFNTTLGYPEWYSETYSTWIPFYDPGPYQVQYLVVAGGAGGGHRYSGGGAGGYRCSVTGENSGGGNSAESPITVTPLTAYTVTVGAGGAGGTTAVTAPTNGSDSVFSTITSVGGGRGGVTNALDGKNGKSGGSGGGATGDGDTGGTTISGGAGTSGQGYGGGNAWDQSGNNNGGAGGGAGAAGGSATSATSTVAVGGIGVQSSIDGTATYRAGGGGAGRQTPAAGGAGGTGGGGAGGGTSGSANTGGGGGCGRDGTAGGGGSGVVIIRYLGTQRATGGTVTSSGGYTIHTFTSSGTFTA